MNKVLLIGNTGIKHDVSDGQTLKVRLYEKKLKDEGLNVHLVDLEDFIKRPFSKLLRIKKEIKNCDRIVLISAKRGCRVLIPYINRINKKFNKPFVLPLVGTSVLHYSVDKLSEKDKTDFYINHKYNLCSPNKSIKKNLQQINAILPETEQLCEVFRSFYDLNNVYCLTNFRDTVFEISPNYRPNERCLKIIFLSRIMKEKGVIDLVNCLRLLQIENCRVQCDFYGQLLLDDKSKAVFDEAINDGIIDYCGIVSPDNVVKTISHYDLFVFPTRFIGEGVPGVIVESLLAGVPILTSNFPQSSLILNDGFDSLSFEMFNIQDMKEKIMYIIINKKILNKLRDGCLSTREKYTFSHEKSKFLKYVCGIKEENR